MNRARLSQVAGLDLRHNLKRPLFWIWIVILMLAVWGLSDGGVRIASGDSNVGGDKSFLTSEFANSQLLSMLILIFYSFFIAVAAGMSILRDQELKVDEVLHATPLRPNEYVWGKFTACMVSFLVVLLVHISGAIFFNHALTDAESSEYIGPFSLLAYLKPAIIFGLPTVIFLAGLCFLIGEWTRKPVLVFVVPVALFISCVFFLWNWSPSWLDPRINRLLMLIDPSGFRWLNETWLKVDRGVTFYNTQPVGMDFGFVLSRVTFTAVGILAVFTSSWHFRRSIQKSGSKSSLLGRVFRRKQRRAATVAPVPIASLRMSTRRPGFVRAMLEIARVEFRELRAQPGLYLFVPIIIVEIVGESMLALGAFETPLLNTPGTMVVRSLAVLTTLTCLLLMFYLIESLRREDNARLDPIYFSTPVRTTSVIFGKILANSFVCVAILGAALASMAVVLRIQGTVAFDGFPFLLIWGALLVPTLLLWGAFIAAVYSFTGSRYTSYGLALGALTYTGYQAVVGEMTWVGNWPLWGALQWSDMGVFELDRTSLTYNRVMALGAALFFIIIAVRVFPRRGFDPTRVLLRLRPGALLLTAVKLLPFALLPLVMGVLLDRRVDAGFEGDIADERAKDYWRKNLATWKDVNQPDLSEVDIDLVLDPEQRSMRVDGTFLLENLHDEPLRQFALTGGLHWRETMWTMAGEEYEPEDRLNLFVFTPPEPLQTGARIEVGFRFEGTYPDGSTQNGGGTSTFILPSGIVMTSFGPEFAPAVGFMEGVGIDEDNRYDAREYPDDYHEGITRSSLGTSQPCMVRMRITAPVAYTMNSVGTKIDEQVDGDQKTVVWETEHPVRFFNVVGGKWDVRRGEGTAIYYHPEHTYNLDEMIEALDAARKYYSEWFFPYPWNELKVSEFPALAEYAQGFPTNITFSEAIGFLTKSDPRSNLAFMVMAHESAHQWWGNILNPGDGPGGNILSEGKAHFSTALLFEQVKGPHQRIEFCKRMEDRYNQTRQVDSERALVKIDGTRSGDTTVQYDKGGWVFWMLYNSMGRDAALSGMQSFIAHYDQDRDHAVLQDYVRHMREFAPDGQAYDEFVQQWFFEVVLPEYEIAEASIEEANGGWQAKVRVKNTGTGRMAVEVAATLGERFPDEDEATDEESEDPDATEPGTILAAEGDAAAENPVPYRHARVSIVLAADEEQVVLIPCEFRPERIVIDPDALVLQRGRERAARNL